MDYPHVSDTRRTLTLVLTDTEAKTILDDFDRSKEPAYATKLVIGALCAIRDNRPYGGS